MANGSGAPAATPNPFGPPQQSSTPMGGGSSPLDTGGGMSGGQQQPMQTAAFGSGQGQMPNFATPNMQRYETSEPFSLAHGPFSSVNSTTQQDMMGRGGSGMPFGQVMGQLGFGGQFQPDPVTVSSEYPPQQLDQRAINADPRGFQNYMQQMQQREQQRPGSTMFGQPQQPGLVTDAEDRAQMYRSQTGRQQPMQNPFQQQPQQPSFLQDPEYQGYQTQIGDLQRQMNEYMQKAPMYQQMRDLESKMAPFQQRHQQQQDMQRMQQIQALQQRQFNPYQQQQQYRQPAGIQGLMGMLGGGGGMAQRGYEQYVDSNSRTNLQPRRSMDMPQARPAVMPRSFGREQRYAMPSRDYSSIGSVGAARPADPAVAAEAPVANPSTDYFLNTW